MSTLSNSIHVEYMEAGDMSKGDVTTFNFKITRKALAAVKEIAWQNRMSLAEWTRKKLGVEEPVIDRSKVVKPARKKPKRLLVE